MMKRSMPRAPTSSGGLRRQRMKLLERQLDQRERIPTVYAAGQPTRRAA
jgi:hypothetical protein